VVFKFVYLEEAHPEHEWTNTEGEKVRVKPHTSVKERIGAAEKLVHDLGVMGDIFIDTLDNYFSTSFNAWPAKCFVMNSGYLVFTCGLLGFKNEDKALGCWLEENLMQNNLLNTQDIKQNSSETEQNTPEIEQNTSKTQQNTTKTQQNATKTQQNTPKTQYPAATVRMKTVLVGEKSCGKTSLYTRFAKNIFPDYIPSVFEHYVADIVVDDQQVEIALWDTCGGEEYDRLRPLSYPDTDVVLLMFSFGSADSLHSCSTRFLPEVQLYCPGIPVVLVGGKKDLAECGEVTTVQGRKMAETVGAVEYVETSAKTGEGVEQVFITAVRHRPIRSHNRRCPCLLL